MSVTSSENTSAIGRVLNISSIGARMELAPDEIQLNESHTAAFPPGVKIEVSIAPFGKSPIALIARIVWRKQQVFGVTFVEIPEESRSRLWNLLMDIARKEFAAGHRWLKPDHVSRKSINAD
jgi:hypothetical protein